MADKRISQLNSHTTPSGSDLLVIVNNNETKKITYADLKDSIVINSDNTILNEFSASYLIDSASFDTRIKEATNEQSFNGLISGSSQLTSSYDNRYVLSGSITQTTWDNIENKPNDIISSSAQITAYGFISESVSLSSLNAFTSSYFTDSASVDSRLISLETSVDNDSIYATTGSNIFIGEEIISGSLILSSSVPVTLTGVEGDKKGTITFDENYLYYCFADYTASVGGAGGGATHLFDAQGGIGWNSYGGNYLSVGFSQEGEAVPPVAGWYFIDDNGDVKQLLSDPLWFSGGNPSPYPNGAGWMAVVDSSFVYNDSNSTITFYESNPGGVASDIWKKISLNTISGLISGSQQITDLGFISTSVDIADFVFTSQTITNSSITLQSTSGDIVLNADGNVYKGSATAGNQLLTTGYFGAVIGDESRINTSTGHTITDNLDNIINSIPSVTSLNDATSSYETKGSGILSSSAQISELGYATTGSNQFNGNQIINGAVSIVTPSPGIPNGVSNWVGQGGWNQGFYSNLSTTGGTGTGLTVDVAANGGGYINIDAITINTPGTGYTNGDVITIDNENNLPGTFMISTENGSSWSFDISGSLTTPGNIIVSGSIYADNLLGLVSSSAQITNFGFISESTDLSSLNAFTASYFTDSSSFYSSIDAIMALSASTMLSDIVHNGESFTIQKGTPVYVSGSHGANPIVYVADASNPNKMPVTYIVNGNITSGNNGTGVILGHIEGIDLTGYAEGTSVYVAEGGGWSINPPSGSNSIKQFLGLITKTGTGGKGLVLNPGPATLPNLRTGYIWVGNTNNQASTMMTASFVFTSSYNSDSSSFDSRISSLVSAGVPAGTVSGSSQLTASYDTRYTLSGSVQPLPNGLISGSSQLTSSYDTRYALSASYLTSLNGAISSSSQVLGGSGIYSSSAQLPNGIVSGSAQITAFGFISQSTDLTSLNSFTASYTTDSSSFNTRIVSLTNNTSSYETTGRGIISESVVTISGTAPSVGTGNLWYDSNIGNLYLRYDSNTWVDTSNGVIQTIISDGSLLSTASFNAWTASYTASVPAGTVSGSSQLTSSYDTRYELQGRGIISGSSQITGFETTGRGIISSSAQLTSLGYVTSGGNVTFNSVTANQYIVSSSVYYVTQSYSSGSTIFGNTADDTHQFTGSVSISGSLTASLTNGYFWVGNSLNKTYEVPTSSFVSTTTFNALSQSANLTDIQTSGSIAALQASLGATSTAFSYTNVVNPTNFVLVQYLTSSFNGGVIDALAVNNANGTATSTAYQFANYGNNVGISQNGKQTSGAGAPNLAPSISVSGSYVLLTVTLTGTFNIKGVARLF